LSNPSASKKFTPAGWVVLGSIVAVAALAVVGTARVRTHSGSARAKPAAAAPVQSPALSADGRGRVRASLSTLPLAFEANQGQTDPQVKYMARGNGYTIFLTANDTVFALQSPSQTAPSRVSGKQGLLQDKTAPEAVAKDQTAAIHMHLVGGNAQAQIAPGSQLPGVTNYYIGSDRSKWQAGVKQYAGVAYRDVYPGVNMAFHGEQRQLEFDFIVTAGASPAPINLGFSGTRKIATDAAGNLLLSSTVGDVVLRKPVAYQERYGKRQFVSAEFVQKTNNKVGFALGPYDRSRELVIDPSLSYATYVGGASEDEAFAIALDGSGNAYVTGQTKSLSFNGKPAGPTFNVFVTKVNSNGTAFGYTDIFAATGVAGNCSASGTGSCSGNAIAVDSTGNAYVAGTATAGFPTLSGFQTSFGGGGSDAFVLKLNSSGTLMYSTFLGGSGSDNANAIAIDGSGNVYVAGETHSTDFPIKAPAIQSSNAGGDAAFVTKLDSTGMSLGYSTYLGGSGGNLATGIALDSSKNAYVTGITISSDFPTTSGVVQATAGGADDGFVTEVKADGSAWVYSTYLGGSGADDALGIAVDSAGEAYVTGSTNSTNFPTANAAQNALGGSSATNVFVTKLNAGATALVFSTYYGGTLDDAGAGIALDSFGDAYVTGTATSSNYPVTSGGGALSGTSDALVTEFSNTGFVVYSSFLGGSGTENQELVASNITGPFGAIAVDSSSNAYLAGITASTTGFPITSSGVAQPNYGGGATDGFVAKVGAAPADFSVAVSPTTASTTSGQPTSAVTVTVSSVNSSYGQAVALSCGSLPSKAVCHFTSASVTPGSSAATSSLTIATNGASSSSKLTPDTNRGLTMFYAMFLPVGIALLGVGNRSRSKRLFGFLLPGVILMGLLMLPACGSGSGGGGGGNNTAPGVYRITVSGQGGGATHSAPLTLTVH
jgi:hypothetical protein